MESFGVTWPEALARLASLGGASWPAALAGLAALGGAPSADPGCRHMLMRESVGSSRLMTGASASISAMRWSLRMRNMAQGGRLGAGRERNREGTAD